MKYLFLLFSFFWIASCGPHTSEPTDSSDTAASSQQTIPVINGDYFALLKGQIGTYPVTLYLFALYHKFSGYYYYDSRQLPLYFSGEDTSAAGKMTLTAYGTKDSTETFTLSFEGRKAAGNWQLGSQSLPVDLEQTDMPIQFDYVGSKDSTRLVDTMAASPQATAEVSSVWPKGNSATDEFIRQQIALQFNDKNLKTDIYAILQAVAKQFFTGYKKDSTVTEENIREHPEQYGHELSSDLRIAYLTAKLLVLASYDFTYLGGAHGLYGTTYQTLDIQHNKVLQLQDILTPDGAKQLRPLLEQSFRRDHHLRPSQPLDTDGYLFENKIEPNSNFYVTGKGLIFSYQPYEIGPYAVGEITIMLNFTELQPYLQPAFQALLQ